MSILDNVSRILSEISPDVTVVAAAKTRTPQEISEAIAAGIFHIGENYVQEAILAKEAVSYPASWHFIGHLQRNKVKDAIKVFDMIQTVDSLRLAREIDKRARNEGLRIPVLIEINSARETQKSGVFPEDARALVEEISSLGNIVIRGLMTMGPFLDSPEEIRPYFRLTRDLYNKLRKLETENADFSILSMGMSDSYQIAIEEGANMVRIGTAIFGPRPDK
ncbi:MAG TPA: YggS family pyridoxal phosphate-dependent enzyme [Kosmotogaceae bacterium]|nr:MAG: Alanine racemase domain protein [Thermotogales bacterium 46_20]HAA86224.1 YggS family pyridoxal phosphate-dependent enzyme [Kosmotogaceae bacterium]